jgi:hypothetical protein
MKGASVDSSSLPVVRAGWLAVDEERFKPAGGNI